MTKHVYILSCKKDGGIFHYLFNDGIFTQVDAASLDYPMYAIIKNNKMYVILKEVDEQTHFGGIISYDIDPDGKLINPSPIDSTNGIEPCHLEASDDAVYVVNYTSGNIIKLGERVITHQGSSWDPIRQEAAHTHFVCFSPDEQYILCVDLGLDKIFVYTKDLDKVSEVNISLGYGPRHMIFSPKGDYAFVACELSSTVEMFAYSGGNFSHLNSYSCLPKDMEKGISSYAAAIRQLGNYLYVSNRGHDSIAVFEIAENALHLLQIVPCGGHYPRDINILDHYLIVTNELSDQVTVFEISDQGTLTKRSAELNIPTPLCILSKDL